MGRSRQVVHDQITVANDNERVANVASVERGEEKVSIDSLARMAKAWKVSLGDLVRGV